MGEAISEYICPSESEVGQKEQWTEDDSLGHDGDMYSRQEPRQVGDRGGGGGVLI